MPNKIDLLVRIGPFLELCCRKILEVFLVHFPWGLSLFFFSSSITADFVQGCAADQFKCANSLCISKHELCDKQVILIIS